MFRFVAVVTGDQLETLLLAAKAVGVNPELGVEPGTAAAKLSPRRKYKRKGHSTKRGAPSKPKRYKASMQVKMGPEPVEGPPKLIQLHRALRKKFGEEPFRKGDAKRAVSSQVKGYSGGMMTRLLDKGNMVVA